MLKVLVCDTLKNAEARIFRESEILFRSCSVLFSFWLSLVAELYVFGGTNIIPGFVVQLFCVSYWPVGIWKIYKTKVTALNLEGRRNSSMIGSADWYFVSQLLIRWYELIGKLCTWRPGEEAWFE